MDFTRRDVLKQFGAASLLGVGAIPPSFLQRAVAEGITTGKKSTQGRVLVVIQLAGGNDGINTVVPYGDPAYHRARPGIGFADNAVLKLDKYLGLHPSLKGLKSLFDQGNLGIVQGVGYPNPNRSHFRSMDIWQSARPDAIDVQDGWLGRALDTSVDRHTGTLPAIAVGFQRLPLSLVSKRVNVPNIEDFHSYSIQVGDGTPQEVDQRKKVLKQLASAGSTSNPELEFLRNTTQTAYASAERLKAVTDSNKTSVKYPGSHLGEKLKGIAQIIAGDIGTEIFFVSLDGFDTHSQQLKGHASLLLELGDAVKSFFEDLKSRKLSDRVMVATYSEFGRRVKENASLGTDHGAASQMFLVSGSVKGGVHGKHPSLTDLDDGDLKYHTDFRSVYATLLEKWLQYPSQKILGRKFPLLNFV